MMPNNPEGMIFPGLYDDKVKVVLDMDNDLVIEDDEHCIYMGSEGLVSFYTWLGDHMQARGLLDG